MPQLILLTLLIVGACVFLLCVGILLKKNGHFPKTHVSSSAAMRKHGITCAQSQDYAARHRRTGVAERVRQ